MIFKNILIRENSFILLIILLIILFWFGLNFLYFIGNNELEQISPSFQFFADSNTYLKMYRDDLDGQPLVKIDGNYLGPIAVLIAFDGNNYLVMLFNFLVFGYSVIQIGKTLRLNAFHLAVLLLISPITLSNLLSVNKEIFFYPFLALALNAYIRKSIILILFAAAVSVMVRWQLTIFYVTLVSIIYFRALSCSRLSVLIILLLAISVGYLLIRPIIEPVLSYVQLSNETYDGGGSGLFERIMEMQNSGLYFLVFPIKALHLLFGMGVKFDKMLNPVDLYNDFFVSVHCAATLIVFSLLAIKRKITLDCDLLFVALIFLAVLCVTPIYAPRYLYLFFVLAVLVLAGAPSNLRKLKEENN